MEGELKWVEAEKPTKLKKGKSKEINRRLVSYKQWDKRMSTNGNFIVKRHCKIKKGETELHDFDN